MRVKLPLVDGGGGRSETPSAPSRAPLTKEKQPQKWKAPKASENRSGRVAWPECLERELSG